MPGYFLNDYAFAESLIRDLALPNLKLQFDVYHRQVLHGDVTTALRRLMPLIGHVQIASVPSRNEPMGEELNDRFVFQELDRLGYDGFVGCEYRPKGKTLDGLGWFAPYRGGRRSARRISLPEPTHDSALGCIADDYTGASDVANTLAKQGLRTIQTIGIPAGTWTCPRPMRSSSR